MMRWSARLVVWLLTLIACPLGLLPRVSESVGHPTHIPDFVTESPLVYEPTHFFDSILYPALPPEEPLRLDVSKRVVTRLVEAESKEPDAWFRDDYRIARVTVGLARRGNPIPHIEACYAVLGCHPEQVWPRIIARREALLARDYNKFFGGVSSPRKPARSVSLAEFRSTSSGNTNGTRASNSRAA